MSKHVAILATVVLASVLVNAAILGQRASNFASASEETRAQLYATLLLQDSENDTGIRNDAHYAGSPAFMNAALMESAYSRYSGLEPSSEEARKFSTSAATTLDASLINYLPVELETVPATQVDCQAAGGAGLIDLPRGKRLVIRRISDQPTPIMLQRFANHPSPVPGSEVSGQLSIIVPEDRDSTPWRADLGQVRVSICEDVRS